QHIGEEQVGDQERDQHENTPFERLFGHFGGIPRRFVQCALLIPVAFYGIFYFTEDHLHKDGLRTGPSAPETTEEIGKQRYKNQERKHQQSEDPVILRTDKNPENDKFP